MNTQPIFNGLSAALAETSAGAVPLRQILAGLSIEGFLSTPLSLSDALSKGDLVSYINSLLKNQRSSNTNIKTLTEALNIEPLKASGVLVQECVIDRTLTAALVATLPEKYRPDDIDTYDLFFWSAGLISLVDKESPATTDILFIPVTVSVKDVERSYAIYLPSEVHYVLNPKTRDEDLKKLRRRCPYGYMACTQLHYVKMCIKDAQQAAIYPSGYFVSNSVGYYVIPFESMVPMLLAGVKFEENVTSVNTFVSAHGGGYKGIYNNASLPYTKHFVFTPDMASKQSRFRITPKRFIEPASALLNERSAKIYEAMRSTSGFTAITALPAIVAEGGAKAFYTRAATERPKSESVDSYYKIQRVIVSAKANGVNEETDLPDDKASNAPIGIIFPSGTDTTDYANLLGITRGCEFLPPNDSNCKVINKMGVESSECDYQARLFEELVYAVTKVQPDEEVAKLFKDEEYLKYATASRRFHARRIVYSRAYFFDMDHGANISKNPLEDKEYFSTLLWNEESDLTNYAYLKFDANGEEIKDNRTRAKYCTSHLTVPVTYPHYSDEDGVKQVKYSVLCLNRYLTAEKPLAPASRGRSISLDRGNQQRQITVQKAESKRAVKVLKDADSSSTDSEIFDESAVTPQVDVDGFTMVIKKRSRSSSVKAAKRSAQPENNQQMQTTAVMSVSDTSSTKSAANKTDTTKKSTASTRSTSSTTKGADVKVKPAVAKSKPAKDTTPKTAAKPAAAKNVEKKPAAEKEQPVIYIPSAEEQCDARQNTKAFFGNAFAGVVLSAVEAYPDSVDDVYTLAIRVLRANAKQSEFAKLYPPVANEWDANNNPSAKSVAAVMTNMAYMHGTFIYDDRFRAAFRTYYDSRDDVDRFNENYASLCKAFPLPTDEDYELAFSATNDLTTVLAFHAFNDKIADAVSKDYESVQVFDMTREEFAAKYKKRQLQSPVKPKKQRQPVEQKASTIETAPAAASWDDLVEQETKVAAEAQKPRRQKKQRDQQPKKQCESEKQNSESHSDELVLDNVSVHSDSANVENHVSSDIIKVVAQDLELTIDGEVTFAKVVAGMKNKHYEHKIASALIKEYESKIQKHDDVAFALREQNETLQKQNAALEKTLADMAADFKNRIASAEEKLLAVQQECEEKLKTKDSAILKLREVNTDVIAKLAKSKQQCQQLEQTVAENSAQLAQLQTEVDGHTAALEAAAAINAALNQEVAVNAEKVEHFDALFSECSTLKFKVESLGKIEEECNAKTAEVESLKLSVRTMQEKVSALSSFEDECRVRSAQCNTLQKENAKLSGEIDQAQRAYNFVSKALINANKKIDELTQYEASATSELDALRELVRKHQDGDFIHMAARYRRALAVYQHETLALTQMSKILPPFRDVFYILYDAGILKLTEDPCIPDVDVLRPIPCAEPAAPQSHAVLSLYYNNIMEQPEVAEQLKPYGIQSVGEQRAAQQAIAAVEGGDVVEAEQVCEEIQQSVRSGLPREEIKSLLLEATLNQINGEVATEEEIIEIDDKPCAVVVDSKDTVTEALGEEIMFVDDISSVAADVTDAKANENETLVAPVPHVKSYAAVATANVETATHTTLISGNTVTEISGQQVQQSEQVDQTNNAAAFADSTQRVAECKTATMPTFDSQVSIQFDEETNEAARRVVVADRNKPMGEKFDELLKIYNFHLQENKVLYETDAQKCVVGKFGIHIVKKNTIRVPAEYHLNLHRVWFDRIVEGRKVVEGRINRANYARMQAGDTILFKNGSDTVRVKITGATVFPTFHAMLKEKGIENVLPGVDTLVEGVRVYEKISGYAEGAKKDGVLAIDIEVIEPPKPITPSLFEDKSEHLSSEPVQESQDSILSHRTVDVETTPVYRADAAAIAADNLEGFNTIHKSLFKTTRNSQRSLDDLDTLPRAAMRRKSNSSDSAMEVIIEANPDAEAEELVQVSRAKHTKRVPTVEQSIDVVIAKDQKQKQQHIFQFKIGRLMIPVAHGEDASFSEVASELFSLAVRYTAQIKNKKLDMADKFMEHVNLDGSTVVNILPAVPDAGAYVREKLITVILQNTTGTSRVVVDLDSPMMQILSAIGPDAINNCTFRINGKIINDDVANMKTWSSCAAGLDMVTVNVVGKGRGGSATQNNNSFNVARVGAYWNDLFDKNYLKGYIMGTAIDTEAAFSLRTNDTLVLHESVPSADQMRVMRLIESSLLIPITNSFIPQFKADKYKGVFNKHTQIVRWQMQADYYYTVNDDGSRFINIYIQEREIHSDVTPDAINSELALEEREQLEAIQSVRYADFDHVGELADDELVHVHPIYYNNHSRSRKRLIALNPKRTGVKATAFIKGMFQYSEYIAPNVENFTNERHYCPRCAQMQTFAVKYYVCGGASVEHKVCFHDCDESCNIAIVRPVVDTTGCVETTYFLRPVPDAAMPQQRQRGFFSAVLTAPSMSFQLVLKVVLLFIMLNGVGADTHFYNGYSTDSSLHLTISRKSSCVAVEPYGYGFAYTALVTETDSWACYAATGACKIRIIEKAASEINKDGVMFRSNGALTPWSELCDFGDHINIVDAAYANAHMINMTIDRFIDRTTTYEKITEAWTCGTGAITYAIIGGRAFPVSVVYTANNENCKTPRKNGPYAPQDNLDWVCKSTRRQHRTYGHVVGLCIGGGNLYTNCHIESSAYNGFKSKTVEAAAMKCEKRKTYSVHVSDVTMHEGFPYAKEATYSFDCDGIGYIYTFRSEDIDKDPIVTIKKVPLDAVDAVGYATVAFDMIKDHLLWVLYRMKDVYDRYMPSFMVTATDAFFTYGAKMYGWLFTYSHTLWQWMIDGSQYVYNKFSSPDPSSVAASVMHNLQGRIADQPHQTIVTLQAAIAAYVEGRATVLVIGVYEETCISSYAQAIREALAANYIDAYLTDRTAITNNDVVVYGTRFTKATVIANLNAHLSGQKSLTVYFVTLSNEKSSAMSYVSYDSARKAVAVPDRKNVFVTVMSCEGDEVALVETEDINGAFAMKRVGYATLVIILLLQVVDRRLAFFIGMLLLVVTPCSAAGNGTYDIVQNVVDAVSNHLNC